MYTKDIYKTEMKQLISKNGYDPKVIAKRAYEIYLDHMRDIDDEFRDKLLDVATMENGPEFEMTEKEFNNFLDEM